MSDLTIRSLGIERPGAMYFFSYDEGPVPDGHFRVQTLYTGFSAGTELTLLKGSNPYLHARWDDQFCAFLPDEPTIRYPMPFLGYMEAARVTESRTPVVRPGEVVAMAYGHKTAHTANTRNEFFIPVPPAIDPLAGIYIAQMGPICANGLLHAGEDLAGPDVRTLGDGVRGRNVLVNGAGIVGMITALFARLHGAAGLVVADRSAYRRGIAVSMGFDAVDECDAWRFVKERWTHAGGDRGADIVFQCRADSASLHSALRALRPQGSVIDLAFYQGGANDLRLGEEFHHNGLNIRCAQIGRVPRRLSFAWNRRRLAQETIELLRIEGHAIRNHLMSDVVPFESAPALLAELVTKRRDFMQIVFRVSE